MPTRKKRRTSPEEEDLAAAVADMIHSPITRVNFSFLRPVMESDRPDAGLFLLKGDEPTPMGVEPSPVGVGVSPMVDSSGPPGYDLRPMGVVSPPAGGASTPMGLESAEAPVLQSAQPATGGATALLHDSASTPAPPLGVDSPVGGDPTPMGFEPQPPPLQPQVGVAPATLATFESPPARSQTPSAQALWQAENLGAIFPASRVHRIKQAQDALSLVEEAVYNLLWGPKNQQRDTYRLTHYSLQRIATDARLNIKTVRELLPRLIQKGFIQVERQADAQRNIPTQYRVFSYGSIREDQNRRGRLYVARTGKGVFYVNPVSVAVTSAPIPMGFDTSPMGVTPSGPGPRPLDLGSEPVSPQPMGPMGARPSKPMGSSGYVSKDIYKGTTTRQSSVSPATYATLIAAIRDAFHVEPDDQLLAATIAECDDRALQATGQRATEEELEYFTRVKTRAICMASNIRNHLAVFRKALPECFTGEAFRLYRQSVWERKQQEEQAARDVEVQKAAEIRELAEAEERFALWTKVSERHKIDRGYDMEAIASDPEIDEEGRRKARELVRRLGRYTRGGL